MSDRRGPSSVTRLLGLNLTPGKLRGLQRISNANGTLVQPKTGISVTASAALPLRDQP